MKISTPDGLEQINSRLAELRQDAAIAAREGQHVYYQNIVEAGKRLRDFAELSDSASRVNGHDCKYCESKRMFEFVGDWPGNHYSRIVCGDCGQFKEWGKKPRASKRKRSTKGHAELLQKYGKGFCEMCLRQSSELNVKHGLQVHHVIEHADGGSNERDNVWIVCAHCHSQIHLHRNYLACKALKRAEGRTA